MRLKAFFVVHPTGNTSAPTLPLARIYGYESPQDLLGAVASVIQQPNVNPDDRTRFSEILEKQGVVDNYGTQDHRKDGTKIWISCAIRAVRDENGKVAYFEGIIEDITDRKRLEETLEKETFYRVLENDPTGVFLIGPDGTYRYVNPEITRITGYTLEDTPSGREWFRKAFPDPVCRRTAVEAWKKDEQSFRGNAVDREFTITRRDGTTRVVHIRTTFTKGFLVTVLNDVTVRRRDEEALRQSEEKLSDLAELMPQMIYEIHKDGRLSFANREGFRRLGISEDEYKKGINVSNVFPTDEHPKLRRNIEKVAREGSSHGNEYVMFRKDGIMIPVLIYSVPVARNGEHVGFRGIIIDITERKRTEEELKRAEEKYRAIFENAVVGILRTTPDGRMLSANPYLARMHGYSSPEEMLAEVTDTWRLYVDPQVRERLMEILETHGSTENFQTERYRRNGSTIWTSMTPWVVRDSKGKILYIEGTLQDITDRKQAEEALQWKTALLEAQVNTSIDGILVVDENGKRIITNRPLIDLWGIPQYILDDENDAALLGYVVSLVKYPQAFLEKVAYLYDHPYEMSRDEVGFKSGMVLDRYSAPVVGADGHHYGRIWTFRDITERRRAEAEILRSREELRSMADHLTTIREDEKAKIARELHDELGQSLTAVFLQLGWLRKKLRRDQKSLADKIDTMTAITNQAMKTTKRIQGELRPWMLDDFKLCATMEWQAKSFTEHAGIPIVFDWNFETVADQRLSVALFRIFQEALTNIARHAGATGISVKLLQNEREVTLSIGDNGRGIRAQEIHKPLSFGLLGMKERVKALGGTITIQGIPGEGITLHVLIPRDTAR